MKIIGLTGNLGCGKSTVARMLRDLGAKTIDADEVTREIRETDADVRGAIERRFGTLDPAHLGRIVFADADALADLESILHPAVRAAVLHWIEQLAGSGAEVAAIEAIKLLESPLHDRCDATWVVRCDEADALARLARSRGLDEQAARRRLAHQSPQDEKVAAADVVIDGSAPMEETRRQVETAYRALVAS